MTILINYNPAIMLKPLHAQWLVNMYTFVFTSSGGDTTLRGWKKAGISGLLDGTTVLPPEDPFEAIYVVHLHYYDTRSIIMSRRDGV